MWTLRVFPFLAILFVGVRLELLAELARAPEISIPPNWLPRDRINFEDCGSSLKILKLNVSGCTRSPCQMIKEKYVNIEAIFENGQTAKLQNGDSFNHNVSWFISENIIPAIVENKDERSPTSADISNKFSADLFVDRELNAVPGVLHWRSSIRNKWVICFKLNVTIVPNTN